MLNTFFSDFAVAEISKLRKAQESLRVACRHDTTFLRLFACSINYAGQSYIHVADQNRPPDNVYRRIEEKEKKKPACTLSVLLQLFKTKSTKHSPW